MTPILTLFDAMADPFALLRSAPLAEVGERHYIVIPAKALNPASCSTSKLDLRLPPG
jgi:hypothetical protein